MFLKGNNIKFETKLINILKKCNKDAKKIILYLYLHKNQLAHLNIGNHKVHVYVVYNICTLVHISIYIISVGTIYVTLYHQWKIDHSCGIQKLSAGKYIRFFQSFLSLSLVIEIHEILTTGRGPSYSLVS